MNLPTKLILTVDVNTITEGLIAEVVETDGSLKSQTVFHVLSADRSFGLVGTYDQLVDFGAAIMGIMYSWCLTHGKTSWFGDDLSILQEGIRSVDEANRNGSSSGRASARRSGERDESARGTGAAERL